jgi:hypothetical protein
MSLAARHGDATLVSSSVLGYAREMTPAEAALLRRYNHLRDVEVNLSDALAEMDIDSDVALNFAARHLGLPERGEALYEAEDSGSCFEFARYEHRLRGKTVIERMLAKRKPTPGSDTHLVLSAMMKSRVSLFRLGEKTPGLGVQVEDMLFGDRRFLADVQLSKWDTQGEKFIVSRMLVFDDFCMTPCTSWLDFDPELARMMAAGLAAESAVPMAARYSSAEKKTELAADLIEMALCSPDSVREVLEGRFGANMSASPATAPSERTSAP